MSKERKFSSHIWLNMVWVQTNEYASCKDVNRPTKKEGKKLKTHRGRLGNRSELTEYF
jgi:hypothetical protein